MDSRLETGMRISILSALFFFILAADAGNIIREDGKLTIRSGDSALVLDEAQALRIKSFSSPVLKNTNLIREFYLSAKEKGGGVIYEKSIGSEKLMPVKTSESAGLLKLEITEIWPGFNCKKTLEFYENEKFFRIKYDLQFTRDAVYDGIWFGISTANNVSFMLCGRSDGFSLIKGNDSEKDIWSGFDCSAENRCFGFYYEKLSGGFAVMCPDEKSWREIGRSFLCKRTSNRFSLELGKCLKREVRVGEEISFDFFLMAFNCDISNFERNITHTYSSFFPSLQ